jgi:hypothetical protein
MIVYGYTEELETVPVEMSAEEIVALGIDRWRLDLLDPDPITLLQDGRQIRFSRLKEMVLCYRVNQHEAYVVIFQRLKEPVCLKGRLIDPLEHYPPMLVDVQPLNEPHHQHLVRYLELMELHDSTLEKGFLSYQSVMQVAQFALWPREPRCTILDGSSIKMGEQFWGTPTRTVFCGRMFEPVTQALELVPQIAWIFETLNNELPTVHGRSVRKMLTGHPIDTVDLQVSRKTSTPLFARLAAMADVRILKEPDVSGGLQFRRQGCTYIVAERFMPRSHSARFVTTADQVFITPDKLALAGRISWLDIGRRRARTSAGQEVSKEARKSLEDDGFTIAPDCLFHRPS